MKRLDMGQEIIFCGRKMLMGELLSLAKETLDRQAQNKDLPESKPEPEKNCGNCGTIPCPPPSQGLCGQERKFWQPKAAKPQGWEQLVRSMAEFAGSTDKHTEKVIATIRDEIERVREEEKQAVLNFITWGKTVYEIHDGIMADKHREGGK